MNNHIIFFSPQIIKAADVPTIFNKNNNKIEKSILKNKITNDNSNLHNIETKKFNHDNELEENITKDIIIKSNKFNDDDSLIEVKLPNPYLATDLMADKKLITFQLKSKYKSKFADYFKDKKFDKFDKDNINSKPNVKNIKTNKTYKYSDKFDKYINFTDLKKYRAYTNKIKQNK